MAGTPRYFLQEHLTDQDLLLVYFQLQSQAPQLSEQKYDASIGLLLKLMKGTKRLWKRNKIPFPMDEGEQYLWQFWEYLTLSVSYDQNYWTSTTLFSTAMELNKICCEISPGLIRDLDSHPLLPPQTSQEIVQFQNQFLLKVMEYFKTLERPEETFSLDKILIEDDSRLLEYLSRVENLSRLPREACPKCSGRRQIYCGECEGIRMRNAEGILPNKVSLPINILLLLHWRESLHKCTGIHAAVLAKERTVECLRWPKEDHEEDHPAWDDIVRGFDSNRDVLLYPYDDAISAEHFPWWSSSEEGEGSTFHSSPPLSPFKKRLIVLEGPWEGAKTMANRITTIREKLCLPPLPSVTLPPNITSHYWRLQHMGSGAVSTIEAIANVVSLIKKNELKIEEENEPEKETTEVQEQKRVRRFDVDFESGIGTTADTLLLLFNLQRHRMLSNIKQGGKVPMAIAASNNREYSNSWSNLISKASAEADGTGSLPEEERISDSTSIRAL